MSPEPRNALLEVARVCRRRQAVDRGWGLAHWTRTGLAPVCEREWLECQGTTVSDQSVM